jgi:hypothetical protein
MVAEAAAFLSDEQGGHDVGGARRAADGADIVDHRA